jgi:hypothetical protein
VIFFEFISVSKYIGVFKNNFFVGNAFELLNSLKCFSCINIFVECAIFKNMILIVGLCTKENKHNNVQNLY